MWGVGKVFLLGFLFQTDTEFKLEGQSILLQSPHSQGPARPAAEHRTREAGQPPCWPLGMETASVEGLPWARPCAGHSARSSRVGSTKICQVLRSCLLCLSGIRGTDFRRRRAAFASWSCRLLAVCVRPGSSAASTMQALSHPHPESMEGTCD